MYVCRVQITSLQNTKVKQLTKLQQKSRERNKSGTFVVEGIQENRLALENNFEPTQFFVQPEIFKNALELPNAEVFEVNQEVFNKIAYRNSTGGIVGVYKSKNFDLAQLIDKVNPLLVVLEAVEKPGNLGAILRTCDAAQVDAVIVCDRLVDFYNPNVIRSSVGTVFTNKLIGCDKTEVVDFCQKNNLAMYATFLREDTKSLYEVGLNEASAIIFGTEATGLSDFWAEHATQTIKIPMLGQVDSLNVSNAVAVCVYEAVRQRI